MDYVSAGHLGGYLVGGDAATFYPDLWKWLVEELGVKSVLDIGCGEGQALQYFRDFLGCKVAGLEGVPQKDPDIIQWDFTKGKWTPEQKFDLVWACEFLEHIEEQYISNLVPAFQSAPLVLVTYAFPGQQGYHHVNCRNEDYWLGFFAAAGFVLDNPKTMITREVARKINNPYNHYLRSGLVFKKV